MTADHDTLMRRTRLLPRSTGKRISPTTRDLRWFAMLAEHGPLPSSFLLAASADTHQSRKRAQERLTDLFHEANTPDGGPYLTRPLQQFRTIDSHYNQLVYDLAPAGRRALKRSGLAKRKNPAPSGPWLHRFMTSCITASIELSTMGRAHLSYVSQSEILERAEADLRYPVSIRDGARHWSGTKDLIPDALFGLRYHGEGGDRFRFFAVEADRATEPVITNNWGRKSFLRSLLQYDVYVRCGVYKKHLGLTAPLLVLNVISDARRMERMIEYTANHHPEGNAFMLFQTWGDFSPAFSPPNPNHRLLVNGWARGGLPSIRIDLPT